MEHAARERLFPSVILFDLVMPGVDSYSFLEWMQASWGDRHLTPPIIVMTADPIDTTSYPFSPLVKQILVKPFHLRDLEGVMRTWCL